MGLHIDLCTCVPIVVHEVLCIGVHVGFPVVVDAEDNAGPGACEGVGVYTEVHLRVGMGA